MEQTALLRRSPIGALLDAAAANDAAAIIVERAPFAAGDLRVEGLPFMQALLDHVQVGLAVIGAERRVLFANRAALWECGRQPGVQLDGGRLVCTHDNEQDAIVRAIADAAGGRWSVVHLQRGGGNLMLAVMPLWPAGGAAGPALLVFGRQDARDALSVHFYAQASGLTPSEARVLRGLGEGLTPRLIAARHGIGLSTVRTQIRSIRSKTGATSIVDLVRTLGRLPPIMPAAAHAMN